MHLVITSIGRIDGASLTLRPTIADSVRNESCSALKGRDTAVQRDRAGIGIIRGCQTAHSSPEGAMDALERIKKQVTDNPIILYMKGTPDFPQCGFSARTVQALNACDVEYAYVNIYEDEEIYRALPKFANWPTFPQLYVKGELVGGCDIALDLHQSGELAKMLHEAATKKAA
jgi:monothiol glutaredoxin